ncbi:polysaccharide biosynthesis tyrosine autokinase [Blastococcus mobilis]|uniref:non-specific protein-tyrosine kinase n=1 Tax=Blastococcus mobilis TaxID=1938746 RepID=A0A238Z3A6_9ACTN|nr:polysaccharide biosynthesis tyrosine autokinase [Blastococcus mobilis]SNR77712.1 receptor protein-tyrosine kinase [Blastococcus mobilis]
MELKDVVQALRNGWWLLVVGLLVGLAAAGVVTWQTTPQYTSSTQLFVSTTGTDDTSTAYQGNLFSQQRVTSYVQLLTGEQLAGRVIEQLGLSDAPSELTAGIAASAIPDTVLLDVAVTRTSATEARDIASAIGQEFTEMVTELETPEGATSSTVKVTVTEAPKVADSPTTPQPLRNLALGALAGLLVGAGAAIGRERLDNTVKTPDDVTRLAGVGLVGALVEDPALLERHVVTDEDGYSETAEAYRQIRTNLQFLDVDDPARTIVITSSLPGEGKTTVAVNLALVLAQSGARVALIEGDLRRPRVTNYLGMISGAGLSNVLAGTARYDELTQPYGDGCLSVLAAGPMPPNPSEMLGSKQMRSLLAQAREENDYVIVDAPPLLPVTDAAVLSVAADGAIIVARHGVTTHAQLQQAATALHRIEAKLLGVLLNRIPPKAADSYGYGYSYSYAATPEQPGGGAGGSGGKSGPARMIDHTTSLPPVPAEGGEARVSHRPPVR